MTRRAVALLAAVLLAGQPARLVAQGVEYVKANYTKYEFRIPMRDGVKLFTSVYVPKDASKTYPVMLMRTPYSVGPYGLARSRRDLGPSPLFGTSGYIFAYQDVRGRWMSEGQFVNMRPHRADRSSPNDTDESTDTYDTIEWLLRNVPGHSGKVGMSGISYPGFYTDCGILSGHPALVAASPQAPVTDWFVGDDFHHNGAVFLPHLFNFMANFGKPRPVPISKFPYLPFEHGTPDGYAFFLNMGPLPNADERYFKGEVAFWNEVMAHPDYDAFWQARNIRPHLKDIKPAVLTVGGWFDAENLFGALETYKAIEKSTPGATNTLVMGPWNHGGWSRGEGDSLGHVRFDQKTSEFYRQNIEFPFFEHHLKGVETAAPAEAQVFETGRNQWHRHDAWPPRGVQPAALHLHANGRLAFEPPVEDDPMAFDEYVSDPARPVPYIDSIAIGMTVEYMVGDQRFAGRRPDVLVYQTPPLEADTTLAGPIRAELFVSTTGTDSDWIVKLIDVYPDDFPDPDPNPSGVRMGGFQQLIRGEVMRGKYRDSYEDPQPFEPGKATAVGLNLQDVYHTFRAGHRIMVQVQSTWFPLVDRNPQRFEDIYRAKASDFQKATQRVYHSRGMPSRLNVLVLPQGTPDSSAGGS
jgi:putative CocE/NonD family hydrolase